MRISSSALLRMSILLAVQTGSSSAFTRQLVTRNLSACSAFSASCRLLQGKTRHVGALKVTADDETSDSPRTTSMDFAVDPKDEEARLLTSRLGLDEKKHKKLVELASLVVEWNKAINLISRKDCTESVVFGRHIIPSLAVGALPDNLFSEGKKVVDVGTGGGFPGLPLAIAYPETDFLLVDSVGKKLTAVKAMAEDLGLDNVMTHHGRAEEIVDDVLEGSRHRGAYDVCVGRSVAALPKFCFWISDLLKEKNEGKLLYIIGGEMQENIITRAESDTAIEDLLDYSGASDKRILVFGQKAVSTIAAESGEAKEKRGTRANKGNSRKTNKKAKGAWTKRDNSKPKQRGYEGFKRVEVN